MAFKDFAEQTGPIELLQRSLDRGRLGHAYLFTGPEIDHLEEVTRALVKTLNCESPPKRGRHGSALDCCDACLACRKIDRANHPDVRWVRPESKSRVITIDQMRDLMQTVNLKPTQAALKVSVIVAADRLNVQAANAFLKTLEEPPADSILVLLSTDPQRLLETILSRCLRLNFAGEGGRWRDPAFRTWLQGFSQMAASESSGMLGRYRLLSVFLNRLNEIKETIKRNLAAKSPLEQYDDIDPKLKEKWEDELEASIEAEYRRQRVDLLAGLQWWFRDVCLATMNLDGIPPFFPELASSVGKVAARMTPREAMKNLEQLEQTQGLLNTNVQEALALEVGLLKLTL
jgi:DNA polymerase III subunit delta'